MNNERILYKTNRKSIYIWAICLLVLSFSIIACTNFISNTKIVNADYENNILNNPNAVLNFNQLWDPTTLRSNYSNILFTNTNGLIGVSGTNNNSWDNTSLPISDTTINLIANHKYYMCYNFVGSVPNNILLGLITGSDVIFDISQDLDGIYTSPSNQSVKVRFGVYHQTSYNTQFYVYLIDLTNMFGSNENVPDLEQCQQLFLSEYYNYTTGNAITLSDLSGYAKGVADTLGSFSYDTLNYSAFYSCYIVDELSASFPEKYVQRYIDNTVLSVPFLKARGVLGVPFNNIAKAGSIIKFMYIDPSMGGSGNYLWCGIYYNNNFVPIMRIDSDNVPTDENGYITFTTPFDTSTLLFCESSQSDNFIMATSAFWIGDLKVENAQIGSIENIIQAYINGQIAQDSEYWSIYYNDYYREYYGPNGEGYLTIYNKGLLDASSNNSVFQDSWGFVGSAFKAVGDMLTLEIFPNVPLGIFVAFPLLLGLIFFIVKIAKGGS